MNRVLRVATDWYLGRAAKKKCRVEGVCDCDDGAWGEMRKVASLEGT